jgi:hypothetical protein
VLIAPRSTAASDRLTLINPRSSPTLSGDASNARAGSSSSQSDVAGQVRHSCLQNHSNTADAAAGAAGGDDGVGDAVAARAAAIELRRAIADLCTRLAQYLAPSL